MMKVAVKKKKKNMVLRVAFILLTLYIAVSLLSVQIEKSRKMQVLEDTKAARIEEELKNQELNRMLGAENNDELIEQLARDQGYVYDDEVLYTDGTGE